MYFIADTNDLNPATFLRYDLFSNKAVLHGMDNSQHLNRAVLCTDNRALVAG